MSVAELMDDSEDTAATLQPQPPGNLTVVVRHEPEAAVVAVAGEIDLLTAPQLTAALDELVRTTTRHIAIDLSETTFMDSAGVHVLLQAHQRVGRHLAVICAPGPVLRTLELLGLTKPLGVLASLEEYRLRRSGS